MHQVLTKILSQNIDSRFCRVTCLFRHAKIWYLKPVPYRHDLQPLCQRQQTGRDSAVTATTVLLLLLLHAPGTQHTLHAPHAETRQPEVVVVFDEMFVQICTRPCPKTRSLGHLQGPLLPQKGKLECLIGLNVLPPKSPPLYHQGDLGGTFQPLTLLGPLWNVLHSGTIPTP